jgi:hypothetical protein
MEPKKTLKKNMDSRTSEILSSAIMEQNLPIDMEVSQPIDGRVDVVFFFDPEMYIEWEEFFDEVLDPIYML